MKTKFLTICTILILSLSTIASALPPGGGGPPITPPNPDGPDSPPSDIPAEWNGPLENKNINEDSPGGILFYDLKSRCTDPDSPIIITIDPKSLNYDLTLETLIIIDPQSLNLETSNYNLKVSNLKKDYFGSETITLDCNGVDNYFVFTVNPVNDAPVVSDIPDQTINEGSSFASFDLDNYLTELDGDNIIWSYSGNNELSININSNNIVSITTPNQNWYGSETIIFTATDDNIESFSDSDSATFTVNPVNDAPIANNIISNTNEDTEIILTLDYSDIDINDKAESCSILSVTDGTISQSCVCNNGVCTVGLTPLPNSVEDILADYIVSDGDSDSNIATITITVNPTDDPAVWQVLNNQAIDEDSPDNTIVYPNLLLRCTDIDSSINMQVTSTHNNYDLSFSGNDLVIKNLVPNYNSVETVNLDCNGIPNSFVLTINSVNDLPTAEAGPDMTVDAGTIVTFDGYLSSDIDGTIVSYEWDFGDGSLTELGQVVTHAFPLGTYTITLTVTDNKGGTDTDTLTVISNGVPTAVAGGPYTGYVGSPITFDGSQSTDDGTIVSYEWNFGDTNIGNGITTTHTYTAVGDYTVILTVTDNNSLTDTDTTTAQITILPINNPPIITSSPLTTVLINQLYTYDVDASDSENDPLTYSLTNAPTGMIIDSNTGLIQWTPTSVGAYNVAIRVEDDHTNYDTQIYNIQVSSTPTEPTKQYAKKHLFSIGSISLPTNTYHSNDVITGFIQLKNLGQLKEKNIQVLVSIPDLNIETIATQNIKLGSHDIKWIPFELELPKITNQHEYLIKVDIKNSNYKESRYIPIYIDDKFIFNF